MKKDKSFFWLLVVLVIIIGGSLVHFSMSYFDEKTCQRGEVEINDTFKLHGFEKSAWEKGTYLYFQYNKTITVNESGNVTNKTYTEENEIWCPTDVCIRNWEYPGNVFLMKYNKTCQTRLNRLFGNQ